MKEAKLVSHETKKACFLTYSLTTSTANQAINQLYYVRIKHYYYYYF